MVDVDLANQEGAARGEPRLSRVQQGRIPAGYSTNLFLRQLYALQAQHGSLDDGKM
jgi:hypothetical protein